MLWRDTPTACASCSCVHPRALRSSLTRLRISGIQCKANFPQYRAIPDGCQVGLSLWFIPSELVAYEGTFKAFTPQWLLGGLAWPSLERERAERVRGQGQRPDLFAGARAEKPHGETLLRSRCAVPPPGTTRAPRRDAPWRFASK